MTQPSEQPEEMDPRERNRFVWDDEDIEMLEAQEESTE